jgi:hypothetical protein
MVSPVRKKAVYEFLQCPPETDLAAEGGNGEHEGESHGSEDSQVHGRFSFVRAKKRGWEI